VSADRNRTFKGPLFFHKIFQQMRQNARKSLFHA
jgi:hypothetical protein